MFWLKTALQATILTFLILLTGVTITPVFGVAMESASWKIQQDSINFGGGYGSSDSYTEEDTLGEIATGWTYSDSYSLHAGYQQMDQETSISFSVDATSTTLMNIPGMTGGTATDSVRVAVSTNNTTGYTLDIAASTSPALQVNSSTTFPDYAPVGADPDYDWAFASTSAGFGFTPEGDDVVQRFLDNGSNTCNYVGGVDTPGKCWDKFTTSPLILSQSSAANLTFTTTTVIIKAEVSHDFNQPSGAYHGRFTFTAYVN
jgi:hypothetical protein